MKKVMVIVLICFLLVLSSVSAETDGTLDDESDQGSQDSDTAVEEVQEEDVGDSEDRVDDIEEDKPEDYSEDDKKEEEKVDYVDETFDEIEVIEEEHFDEVLHGEEVFDEHFEDDVFYEDEYREDVFYEEEFHDEYFDERFVHDQEYDMCPPQDELLRIESDCQSSGGNAHWRMHGECSFVECSFSEGAFFNDYCPSDDEVDEKAESCLELGLDPVMIPSGPGCAPRVECQEVHRGYGVHYDEFKRGRERFDSGEIDSTEILEIILQMDSIKIQISGIQDQLNALAVYYEDTGDVESAARYYEAADILGDIDEQVDNQKENLRSAVESNDLSWDSIHRIKSELKYSVDGLLGQVIGALLGVEYDPLKVTGELDCGLDDYCFEDHFRACTDGASFSPDPGITIKLEGVNDNDECVFLVDTFDGSGTCLVPDYRFAYLEKDSILPYCDEELQLIMEKYDEEHRDEFEEFPDEFGGFEEFDDGFEDRGFDENFDEFGEEKFEEFPEEFDIVEPVDFAETDEEVIV